MTPLEFQFAQEMTARCQYMTIVLSQIADQRTDIHEDDIVTWVEWYDIPEAPNLKLSISRLGENNELLHKAYHTIYLAKSYAIKAVQDLYEQMVNQETWKDI